MLRRVILLCALASKAFAQGDDDDDGIRRPERLTVGVFDNFLGQLHPNGKTMYFVSNRNTVNEIFFQDMETARAKVLFDEGADVTWPRVSPDGKQLLYISFAEEAGGQLCVRELPDGKRRCLDDGTSAVQAQWIDDKRIALVCRSTMQGDLRVNEVTVKRKLKAKPLVERNLVSPAFSPDGRWLVYVPVERYVERVGPGFAARAAQRLEALRLDRLSDPPQSLDVDVPGLSGQPAFSYDGKWLYFVEFFNDSNRDGVVDGSDFGVVFRAPFESDKDDAPTRAAKSFPIQLTDAQWNCQYPSPTRSELLLTCSRGGDLDIYSLPLDGMVPTAWTAERLRLEIDLATKRRQQLILYRHLLEEEKDRTARRWLMMTLLVLHLEFEDFEAGEFYAAHIKAEKDKATRGIASALAAFVEHRKAVAQRMRGRESVDFVAQARARLEKLEPKAKTAPVAALFRRVVRSEIADVLGDKETAREELEGVTLDADTPPIVLELYYRRADALYRELDDRESLFAAARRLSEHPALPPDEQLRYARAAVRALVRGLPQAEAEAAVARQLSTAEPQSELAFALHLSRVVATIPPVAKNRDEIKVHVAVKKSIVDLYKKEPRIDRRRAVMLDAVSRASELDADRLIEALVKEYVDDVPKGTQERRRAEWLYRKVFEWRAYRHLDENKLDKAREEFLAVAQRTRSYESVIGYIDVRLRQGATAAELESELAKRDADYSETVLRFGKAYLTARNLDKLDGPAYDRASDEALKALRMAELRQKREARALSGYLLHDRFTHAGNLAAAQRANVQYLVALEMVKKSPRFRAMVLGQLSILHTQVGNYRMALDYFEEREKLPFADDAGALAHRLMKARALFHTDEEEEAAKEADEALAQVERMPALAEYRVLALDRAALYNLAAGKFERALSLYDAEMPLVSGERNRVVIALARAAAALGANQPRRAIDDVASVEKSIGDERLAKVLEWPHIAPDETLRAYRLIATGLRAKAHRHLGDLQAAERALEARQAIVKLRLERTGVDEHLRALALVEAQLADVAHERGDHKRAADWIKKALAHSDEFAKKTNLSLDADQLHLLQLACELRLSTGQKLGFNLKKRLRQAHEKLITLRDPQLRSHQRWIEIYLAILDSGSGKPRAGGGDDEDGDVSDIGRKTSLLENRHSNR